MTDSEVVERLLDSDPAICWQVMRDPTDAPAEEVAAERARVAREAGRWSIDQRYLVPSLVDFGEAESRPSRWVTLRALRIVRLAGHRAP